jgi:hypothetical protein
VPEALGRNVVDEVHHTVLQPPHIETIDYVSDQRRPTIT